MKRARRSPIILALVTIVLAGLFSTMALGCERNETTTTAAAADTTEPLSAPGDTTDSTLVDDGSPTTGTTVDPSTTGDTGGDPGPVPTNVDGSPVTTEPSKPVLETTKTTVQPPYTPPKGDADRSAIMDAQRAWMASRGLPSNVVFVVDWLRLSSGWAYSVCRPQSPDGSSQYEGIMFLLRDRSGWAVVDVFGVEGEMSEDIDPTATLIARNPGVPTVIFP